MEDAAEKESPYMAKVVNSILADAEQGSCAYTDYEDACDEKHFDTNHLLPNQTIEEYKDEAYNTYIDYLKRVQSQLDKAVNNYNIFVDIFYKPQHRHNERYGYAPKR